MWCCLQSPSIAFVYPNSVCFQESFVKTFDIDLEERRSPIIIPIPYVECRIWTYYIFRYRLLFLYSPVIYLGYMSVCDSGTVSFWKGLFYCINLVFFYSELARLSLSLPKPLWTEDRGPFVNVQVFNLYSSARCNILDFLCKIHL